MRAVHYTDTKANQAICNHRLGLSIGVRRSLPPLVTRDPLKITCGRCKEMAASEIERAKAAAEAAEAR